MSRILILSYYFPPAGGAAVQRWHRFIPALISLGHEIRVICPNKGAYPYLDESLLTELPAELRVTRTGSSSLLANWQKDGLLPYGDLNSSKDDSLIRRMMVWIRINLIIPDVRISWLPAAISTACRELRRSDYDLIITTGPPHSTHLCGLFLSKRFKKPWLADFRDPWSKIHYLFLAKPSRLTMMIHRYLERKVVSRATAISVISHNISNELPSGNKHVFYNGYSKHDFADVEYRRSTTFRIKYIGQLTAGQNITPLLKILLDQKAEFTFIGTKGIDEYLSGTEETEKLMIKKVGFLSHRDAIVEMVNSELLVLLINDYPGSKGMLTTKLFEYLASENTNFMYWRYR
jgi:glycosyltransferase involved in cell wall biosynthesis